MADTYFLGSDALAEVVAQVGQFVGAGVATAMIFLMLGMVLNFTLDLLRGG